MTIRFLKCHGGMRVSERYLRTLTLGRSFNDLEKTVYHVSYAASASRTCETEASIADVNAFLKEQST